MGKPLNLWGFHLGTSSVEEVPSELPMDQNEEALCGQAGEPGDHMGPACWLVGLVGCPSRI